MVGKMKYIILFIVSVLLTIIGALVKDLTTLTGLSVVLISWGIIISFCTFVIWLNAEVEAED